MTESLQQDTQALLQQQEDFRHIIFRIAKHHGWQGTYPQSGQSKIPDIEDAMKFIEWVIAGKPNPDDDMLTRIRKQGRR